MSNITVYTNEQTDLSGKNYLATLNLGWNAMHLFKILLNCVLLIFIIIRVVLFLISMRWFIYFLMCKFILSQSGNKRHEGVLLIIPLGIKILFYV